MVNTTPDPQRGSAADSHLLRLHELDVVVREFVEMGEGDGTDSDLFHVRVDPRSWDDKCPECGQAGKLRKRRPRTVTDRPLGPWTVTLEIRIPEMQCTNSTCPKQSFTAAIEAVAPGSRQTRRCAAYIAKQLSKKRTVKDIAAEMRLSWNTVNKLAKEYTHALMDKAKNTPPEVTALAIDEHCWRHGKIGRDGKFQDRFYSVIYDISTVGKPGGKGAVIAMVPGRSKKAFATWLAAQTDTFKAGVQVVSMDGFTAYANAAKEHLPNAIVSLDPFHVVKLFSTALDRYRRKEHTRIFRHRGRNNEGLYPNRRLLLTGQTKLDRRGRRKLQRQLDKMPNAKVYKALRKAYNWCSAAYAEQDLDKGRLIMTRLIDWLRLSPWGKHEEFKTLRTTMSRRAADILAHFDTGVSNASAEALNSQIKCLRRLAQGFRNPENYEYRIYLQNGPKLAA